MEERLQKLISASGLTSRRGAEDWITAGRVTVNGRVAALGDKADLSRDQVLVDGRPLPQEENRQRTYLMLNKPRGYVSTLSDEKGRRTVAQLVSGCGCRVWPVGRLDMDSEGLLLLTDDGPLGHELLSPKKHVDKVYLAQVEGKVDRSDVAALAEGMVLGDGLHCLPAGLKPLGDGSTCLVTLREGKYHQVKRMLAARGKPVTALHRLSMGPLKLEENLKPGQWRMLTEKEIGALRGE